MLVMPHALMVLVHPSFNKIGVWFNLFFARMLKHKLHLRKAPRKIDHTIISVLKQLQNGD